MPRILENRLIETFKDRAFFSREELFDFYLSFEPELNHGTFGWRIYDLKHKNIIRPIKRGQYIISNKLKYEPPITEDLLKLAEHLNRKYQGVRYCVWETEWLNEFSQHQANKRMVLVEIEKDLVETLYYDLKDSFGFDIYLDPDRKTLDLYVSESNRPMIVKRFFNRSPIATRTENNLKFHIPKLEKILVDLFAEDRLFYFLQGTELIHIFENAVTNYTLNFTGLFGYAKRRGKEQEIIQFMKDHIYHLVKNIVDDK